jgi:predicted Zn finger-like uncharacterized protein
LIIECPQCTAKYQYGEDRFDGKPSKKIRCAKCQTIFEVKNPDHVAAAPAPLPPAAGERFDSTIARKGPGAFVAAREDATASAQIPSRDTGKSEAVGVMPTDKRYSLAILDGPDAGKVYRIEKAKTVIGRSNADLTLNDIESSRHHAAVEIRDPAVLLYDLESTNGTLVGGEKITRPVELSSHSEFQVGTTTLMLIVTDAD